MAMPLMVAPMAMHGLAHSAKELGTARAAAAANTPMVRQPATGNSAHECNDTTYVLLACFLMQI
jgi:isopentenyl diphosphate isomerase/L-lactate dehydrogenase-like FMN-dependent dehydrogenase